MDYRLPYYMAYPMPLLYDDDKIEKRDLEYMKSMYPMTAKRVMPYVEEECDRMEYEGSVIYDEYPDQLQVRMMCNRIYDKVRNMTEQSEEQEIDPPGNARGNSQGGPKEEQLRDLIQVLLFHELFNRRMNNRRRRRRFY